MRPARHLPGIDLIANFFAASPKVVGLLFKFAGGDRVSGDDERSLRANLFSAFQNVLIGRYKLGDTQPDKVGGAVVRERIFGNLKPRYDDHSVLFPRSLGFGANNLEIKGEGRFGEGIVEILRSAPEERFSFANVIRDRDRSESTASVEVDELRDVHFAVTKSRMSMQIR